MGSDDLFKKRRAAFPKNINSGDFNYINHSTNFFFY